MMPKPFSAPKDLVTVTQVFERFCVEHDLTVIGVAGDRHGAWEWSAAQQTDLLRFLTLGLLQDADGSVYASDEGVENAEIWLDVKRADQWIRKRTARFHLDPATANDGLPGRLARSWKRALGFQSEALTDSASATR